MQAYTGMLTPEMQKLFESQRKFIGQVKKIMAHFDLADDMLKEVADDIKRIHAEYPNPDEIINDLFLANKYKGGMS